MCSSATSDYDQTGTIAAAGINVLVGVTEGARNRTNDVHLFDGTTGMLLQSFVPPPSTSAAAYLFDGASGAVLQEFLPPPDASGYFGHSVAVVGDDIIVGDFSGAAQHRP